MVHYNWALEWEGSAKGECPAVYPARRWRSPEATGTPSIQSPLLSSTFQKAKGHGPTLGAVMVLASPTPENFVVKVKCVIALSAPN